MKRLLFVISQFYKGGAEVSLLNLLKKLDKTKYEIDFLVLNQSAGTEAVSLIDKIPKEITVFDAYQMQRNMSAYDKKKADLLLNEEDRRCDPDSALLWIRNRKYDCAFHVGEWSYPFFTAKYVNADRKFAWIHNDLDQAEYFDADNFFAYYNQFDSYIFVSKNSRKGSIKAYPFLKDNSLCIYNINDAEDIRKKSEETVEEDYFKRGLPVILTCANVRKQKNHDRQLMAMKLLKDRGIDFIWLNIGSMVETERCQGLLNKAKIFGLEDRFILAGPSQNPYKYMKHATAVAVLSDYESWSMVITEAKILGKPIIATKTSGALEQIEHGVTGLLTDFTPESIADELEKLLTKPEVIKTIEENARGFDNTQEILRDFDDLVEQPKKKAEEKNDVLLVIDDVNYAGGAHGAAKQLIHVMSEKGKKIDVFSLTRPLAKTRKDLPSTRFYSWDAIKEDTLYHRRLLDCLMDSALPKVDKETKLVMTYYGKKKSTWNDVFTQFVRPGISKFFSKYDTVIVLSEGSELKKDVADCEANLKIQWIHTDYYEWRHASEYAKQRSCKDREYWQKFDRIVLLSENIREKMLMLFPEYSEKFYVVPNFIDVEEIRRKVNKQKNFPCVSFVTVARFEKVKAIPRLLKVLSKLYEEGYAFKWVFIGNGEEWEYCRSIVEGSGLRNCVTFMGAMKNPFLIMKQADVFGLFSYYEGLPNTIYEALALDIPVCATDIGGVRDQIVDGVTGWIAENDEKGIYEKLCYIMEHPEEVRQAKERLKSFKYDNNMVAEKTLAVLKK